MLRIVCLVQMAQMEQTRVQVQRFIERYQKFTISIWSSMTCDLPKIKLMKGARQACLAEPGTTDCGTKHALSSARLKARNLADRITLSGSV
jgi:hypothetical protein